MFRCVAWCPSVWRGGCRVVDAVWWKWSVVRVRVWRWVAGLILFSVARDPHPKLHACSGFHGGSCAYARIRNSHPTTHPLHST